MSTECRVKSKTTHKQVVLVGGHHATVSASASSARGMHSLHSTMGRPTTSLEIRMHDRNDCRTSSLPWLSLVHHDIILFSRPLCTSSSVSYSCVCGTYSHLLTYLLRTNSTPANVITSSLYRRRSTSTPSLENDLGLFSIVRLYSRARDRLCSFRRGIREKQSSTAGTGENGLITAAGALRRLLFSRVVAT